MKTNKLFEVVRSTMENGGKRGVFVQKFAKFAEVSCPFAFGEKKVLARVREAMAMEHMVEGKDYDVRIEWVSVSALCSRAPYPASQRRLFVSVPRVRPERVAAINRAERMAEIY